MSRVMKSEHVVNELISSMNFNQMADVASSTPRPKVNTTADQSKFIIDASCSLNGKVRFVPYSGHSE